MFTTRFWSRTSWIGAVAVLSLFTTSCSGDVKLSIQGCEVCVERCVSDDGIRGRCVTCIKDEQCQSDNSPTKKCDEKNRCICGSVQDCPTGTHCAGVKGCVECFKDEHCTSKDRPTCGLDNSCLPCKPNQQESCLPLAGQFCEPGVRTCQNNSFWGPCEGSKACTTGQKCEDKKCVEACKHECKENAKQCTSDAETVPGKYKTCISDSQGCLVWSTQESACTSTQICNKDQCVPYKCPTTPCQLNKTRCFDDGNYQKCQRDSKGCPVWSGKLKCPSKTQCRNKLNRCTLCEPGEKIACYTGKANTRKIGICKDGMSTCNATGTKYGTCTGQVLPKTEECNGVDDSCDGKVDPGCDCINGKTRSCFTGKAGCQKLSNGNYKCVGTCQPGTETCVKGKWGTCTGETLPVTKEACDGKDDNCDGTPDDGCQCKPKAEQPCGSDIGICKKGKQTCDAQGKWGACVGEVTAQTTESCNGLDDNCDGKVDESFPGLGDTCTDGLGECKQTGKKVCNATKDGAVCDAKPGPKGNEVCDGKDNNCDGNVDEPFQAKGLGGACKVGKGICEKSGTNICNQAQDDVVCHATPGTPATEICNGKDDNCDGAVDENLDRDCYTGTPKTTEGVGVCSKGKEQCVQGKYTGQCVGEVKPSQEICSNQKDDDCDGKVDEQSGRALRFTGNYNRVEFPHKSFYNFSENDSFTLEMWFNFDKLGTRKIALLLNNHKTNTNYGFHLKIQVDASKTAPQCAISWWNGSHGNQILFGDCLAAQWTHIALVYDKTNNKLRFYKDGQVIYDQTRPNDFQIKYDTNNQPLVIGSETGIASQGDPSLRGQVASVRVSNYVRYTQTGQQRFTPSCTFTNDGNTIGLWNLDDGGGTTVKDLATLGNNGTIIGATWANGRTCNTAKLGGCQ